MHFAFDITDRKRTEDALLESETRYRSIFDNGADGIVIIDPETATPVDFNQQACAQLGYTREEFGKPEDLRYRSPRGHGRSQGPHTEGDRHRVRGVRNRSSHQGRGTAECAREGPERSFRREIRLPLHLARHHRAQAGRGREGEAAGAAPAGDEDGGGGPPGGGRGARLQQPAHGDQRVQRAPASEDREGIPDARGSGGDQAGGGAGGVADAAAAGVLPEADHRAEGAAPGRPGGGDAQDADPPDRRGHRVAGHHRQIPGIGEGRPGAVPADPDEPGGERPGCDAGRREDRDRDGERGPGRSVLRRRTRTSHRGGS